MTLRSLLRVLLRRGWLLIPAVVGTTVIAHFASSSQPDVVIGEASVVAPTGATAKEPGNATQASELVETYTILIPEDGGVIRSVAAAVGRSENDAADAISTVTSPGTFLIRLRYEDDDEATALAGIRALTDAVVGEAPAARGVAPGTLRVVRLPRIDEVRTGGSGAAIPIGIFLGLCLGAVLMIALERSDPRVDGEDDAARVLGCPATSVTHLSDASIGALLDRWQRLAIEHDELGRPARIALLPGTQNAEEYMPGTATMLRGLAARVGRVLTVRHPRDTSEPLAGSELELLVGGAPGSEAAGEAIVVASAFAVLVVRRGSKQAELQHATTVLEQFGGRLRWALVVDDPDVLDSVELPETGVPSRPVTRV